MKNLLNQYLDNCQSLLKAVGASQQGAIAQAANLIAESWKQGKRIYVFGCTHSAILAEDVFYRAGCLAIFEPLWGPGMSIVNTKALLTSAMERNEQVGRDLVECSRLEKDDVLIVISTSGKNAAPVEVCKAAMERGVKVIGITSGAYADLQGNHSSGLNMSQLGLDAVIDNQVPVGDASVTVGKNPMGPLSTIAGSFIMHSLSLAVAENLAGEGINVPAFVSSNAPGGVERNRELIYNSSYSNNFLSP